MGKPTPAPNPGDPCPNCGGELWELQAPTDEQRKAAADRDNPAPLNDWTDSAPAAVREELGPLAQCSQCGYRTRYAPGSIPVQAPKGAAPATAGATGAAAPSVAPGATAPPAPGTAGPGVTPPASASAAPAAAPSPATP